MYKRFNETRRKIIVLDEWVTLRWAGKNIDHYQKIGYKYTGFMDEFVCHIKDLLPKSNISVRVQCPICKKERRAKYNNITLCNHTLCPSCANIIDIQNETMGRWHVMELHINTDKKKKRIHWICQCDCGVTRSVYSGHLISGASTSCGCYKTDVLTSQSGEANPNWSSILLACEYCEKEIYIQKSRKSTFRFCSQECKWKWMSENLTGKNNGAWKETLTDRERQNRRSTAKHKKWTNNILKRDKYTCVVCNQIGGDLEVHHLYNYADHEDKRLDPSNGVTMCKLHHAEFHLWMGGNRVKCTENDFELWKMARKKK